MACTTGAPYYQWHTRNGPLTSDRFAYRKHRKRRNICIKKAHIWRWGKNVSSTIRSEQFIKRISPQLSLSGTNPILFFASFFLSLFSVFLSLHTLGLEGIESLYWYLILTKGFADYSGYWEERDGRKRLFSSELDIHLCFRGVSYQVPFTPSPSLMC